MDKQGSEGNNLANLMERQ